MDQQSEVDRACLPLGVQEVVEAEHSASVAHEDAQLGVLASPWHVHIVSFDR